MGANDAAEMLQSAQAECVRLERELSASSLRVRALQEQIADAWDAGFAAADISRPSSRKGHWEANNRHGIRTWIPDPIPTNPHRAVVSTKEDEKP